MLAAQLAYWKQQLGNDLPVLELPTDRPRPAIPTYQGAQQPLVLPQALSDALKTLSANEGVTLFTLLLAAFQLLLHRYTSQDDIVVGTDIANRNRAETEGLIRLLVNTLVLRTNLSGNPTFRELLNRVREVTLGAYAHQDLPFEKLVEGLNPERNLSQIMPLFQVKFDLQLARVEPLELLDLTLDRLPIDNGTTKYELRLNLQDTEQGLKGQVEYSTNLFDATTITRMVEHFCTLLEGIVANPEQRLSLLPLLTQPEQQRLLMEWNDTQANYPKDQCIHQLFEAQVDRSPDAIAVVFEDEQLTYCELNRKANQLAHYLQRLGVGPEVKVGICVERSLRMVVGLLGILKAGGAYVPLDPAYPRERLAFILENSQVSVLLTQQTWLEALPFPIPNLVVVCLDIDGQVIARESQKNPTSGVVENNLAYVIYTSGSTGRPKGVAIEHRGTVVLLNWARVVFKPEVLAGVLASTSICFDLSVFELFVPLSWGDKVILALNALDLPTFPAACDVTLINTVPSASAQLLRVDGIPASVNTVNLAGEALQNNLPTTDRGV